MGGQILVVGLLASLLLGFVPAFIAKGKGRSFLLWYVYGVFLFLIAMIHAIVIKPNESAPGKRLCPSCREVIDAQALTCPFCRTVFGSSAHHAHEQLFAQVPSALDQEQSSRQFPSNRSLESDEYQLYLVKTYGVEKNNTLEKYVVNERLFPSVTEALHFAHTLDRAAEEREKTERRIADKLEEEQRITHRRLQEAQHVLNLRAADERRKQRKLGNWIIGAIALVLALAAAFGGRFGIGG